MGGDGRWCGAALRRHRVPDLATDPPAPAYPRTTAETRSDVTRTPATSRGAGTSVLTSSAVMAAGTVISRLSGFVRSMLLAAALGTQLHADVFNIANTIPNML